MLLIRDFDLDQAWVIIKNLSIENIDEDKIRESRHVIDSFSLRSYNIDRDLIYDSLINKKPVLIGKTGYNSFKVLYEHPTKKSEDIYIIISIDERENILIITTYTNSIKRRIRAP
ncbi:MAG: hypothetical protein Q7V10_02690 [Methanobacteriaceae archaeon]|nr:hypothetical protein [Methanobacteriaceae archaeon]MDO9626117.1 hypothetical protein [Methanobacteriaceae archaeon]